MTIDLIFWDNPTALSKATLRNIPEGGGLVIIGRLGVKMPWNFSCHKNVFPFSTFLIFSESFLALDDCWFGARWFGFRLDPRK